MLDLVPGVAVVVTMALVALMMPLRGPWWWVCVCVAALVIVLMGVNRWLLPSVTGWSLGRAAAGVRVTRSDGSAAGPWLLLSRDLAHLLDTLSVLVGWLWPLWDSRRRTFADLLLRTEVRVEPGPPFRNVRPLAVAVLAVAAFTCTAGAVLGYAAVYRNDRATEHTRAQIARQGPKIVSEMLSYDPKTLPSDFERARSLATDKYREQLAAQQAAVQKGHPVTNEYWVADSSIQSATPDRATMLLFMQGRRGSPPEERYISATVRATFAKGADARWRVDDLSVLTKPKPGQNGK
ncbi:RDD family protein [Mycobacterium botniense]|uniref:RDD family protein n=1 Tax=Mycobacterium botniense TaxID=84962 RepID=A0A7I9XVT4_9MYCO|nr:RDD family protein [Mycobacterium botniense]